MSQETLVLKRLAQTTDWVPSYELVCKWIDGCWIGTSGDRAARKLVEEGKILRDHQNGYAVYKLKTPVLKI